MNAPPDHCVTLMLRVKTGSYLRLEAVRYYCRKKLSSMAIAMAMTMAMSKMFKKLSKAMESCGKIRKAKES